MTDYKPGTVAMVTALNKPEPFRAFYDGETWREIGCASFCVNSPTTIAPLVVLDTEFPRTVVKHLRMAAENDSALTTLSWLADQIEAQTKTPRIPEPGLWGVVEAHADGLSRRKFVHHERAGGSHGYHWVPATTGTYVTWDDLIDPVLVREGVES